MGERSPRSEAAGLESDVGVCLCAYAGGRACRCVFALQAVVLCSVGLKKAVDFKPSRMNSNVRM